MISTIISISISITAIKDIFNSAAAAKVLRGRCHILCRARFLPTDKLLWIAVVEAKTKQEDASQAMRLFLAFFFAEGTYIWWWGCGDDGGGVDGGHGQGRHEVHKDQFKMIMVKGLLYEANSAWSREMKTWVGAVVLRVNIRIARPRNALWRAILRRAILSTSFIRIARPIYFVFFLCWYDLQLVPNVG